jgi:hypothetical protein
LGGLVLEGPEASELALGFDDLLDAGGSEAADQLVLEVGVADVQAGRVEAGAPEVSGLAGVAETGEADALRDERLEEGADVPGPADRDHGDALGREIAAAPGGQRLDGELIAHTFDKDGSAHGHGPQRKRAVSAF